jgi:hypothetical protein
LWYSVSNLLTCWSPKWKVDKHFAFLYNNSIQNRKGMLWTSCQ